MNFRIITIVVIFHQFTIGNISAQSKNKQIELLHKQNDSLTTMYRINQNKISELVSNLNKCQLENKQNENFIFDYQQKIQTLEYNLESQQLNQQKTINNLQLSLSTRDSKISKLEYANDSLHQELISLNTLINSLSSAQSETQDVEGSATNKSTFTALYENCEDDDIRIKIGSFINERLYENASYLGEWPMEALIFCNKKHIAFEIVGNIYYGGAHPEDVDEFYIFNLLNGEAESVNDFIPIQKRGVLLHLLNEKFNSRIEEIRSCGEPDFIEEIPLSPFTNIDGIYLTKNGIAINYSIWPEYLRICDVTIECSWNEIKTLISPTFLD